MSRSKDKKLKKEKKNKKVYPKRTHKQIEQNKSEDKSRVKKKNIENSNKNDLVNYNISGIYDNIIFSNDSIYEFKKEELQNQIYESEFFEIISITRDGNYFYRTVSYFLTGNENSHKNLHEAVYKYVTNNLKKFYEYCYVENNTYYIDIEENNTIYKYILDDYVENIKKNKFLAGFIEINAMSIILNRPIIIFEDVEYLDTKYFKRMMSFINTEIDKINIDDIIFIHFINRNHYQILTPNKIYY